MQPKNAVKVVKERATSLIIIEIFKTEIRGEEWNVISNYFLEYKDSKCWKFMGEKEASFEILSRLLYEDWTTMVIVFINSRRSLKNLR